MIRIKISESQFENLKSTLKEDLDYNKVSDASPNSDEYDMDEGKRTLSRTRKKRLFSKAEIMSNPNRFKYSDRVKKGIK